MKSGTEQIGHKSSEVPRDARVRRTQRALHEALGGLLHEKPFESILIKQILVRADVARATFYAHFDSKEELLASALNDVMNGGNAGAPANVNPVLRFAFPLFEHIGNLRSAAKPDVRQLGFHRQAHGALHRAIREFVSNEIGKDSATHGGAVCALVADQVARTFIVVLHWWLTDAPDIPVQKVHETFTRLVAPALALVPIAEMKR